MKPTGRKNPLGEEIMEIESSDINWDLSWEEMDIHQKADFCSFMEVPFLSKSNEKMIRDNYIFLQKKYKK